MSSIPLTFKVPICLGDLKHLKVRHENCFCFGTTACQLGGQNNTFRALSLLVSLDLTGAVFLGLVGLVGLTLASSFGAAASFGLAGALAAFFSAKNTRTNGQR